MDYRKPSLAKRGNRRRPQRIPSGRTRRVSPEERLLREIFTAPHAVTRLPREQEQRAHEALTAVDVAALLPVPSSPGTREAVQRGTAFLDEHGPAGWRERISIPVPGTPADPRAALLADVRAWAGDNLDSTRYAWDRVASMTDDELGAIIGPRVKTVDGALRKLRPVIDSLAQAS